MKKTIITVIISAIIFTGIGAFAASTILASDIEYRDGTVQDALDNLYENIGTVSEVKSGYWSTSPNNGGTISVQNGSWYIISILHEYNKDITVSGGEIEKIGNNSNHATVQNIRGIIEFYLVHASSTTFTVSSSSSQYLSWNRIKLGK